MVLMKGLGRVGYFVLGAVSSVTVVQLFSGTASAYDSAVYNNLMKTRDALMQQRDYLRQAYDDTSKQIDALQQKMNRINSYLDQNDKNLRDLDTALRQYQ